MRRSDQPGSRAPCGRILTLFVPPRKPRSKEGDPLARAAPPLRYGQPTVSEKAGSAELAPLRCAQTAAAPTPLVECAPRHIQRGRRVNAPWRVLVGQCACHRPRISSLRPSKRRPRGPSGASAAMARRPHHSQAAPRKTSAFAGQGARSCLSRSEFCETPRNASTAGCPQRSGGSQTVGSPFFPTFFGEAKKVGPPPGGIPGRQPCKNKPKFRPQQTDASHPAPTAQRVQTPNPDTLHSLHRSRGPFIRPPIPIGPLISQPAFTRLRRKPSREPGSIPQAA